MEYVGRVAINSMRLLTPRAREAVLVGIVEATVTANREYLRANPRTPPLYGSGARYVFVGSLFQDIPAILATLTGECEGFTAWRVAELRERAREEGARPIVREFQEMKLIGLVHEYHVLVERADGRIEDPSRRLGMP